MSTKDVDDAVKAIQETVTQVQEGVYSAASQLDAGLTAASQGARLSTAYVVNQACNLWTQLNAFQASTTTQLTVIQDDGVAAVREQVKHAIRWAQEYPYFAYGIAVSSVFLFPAPRAYVFRNMLGMMQSQESLFRSATEQTQTFKGSMEVMLKEKETLLEKATTALEELSQARDRATAAKKELAALSSRMGTAIKPMQDVAVRLRALDAKEVVSLRTDLARDLSELASQQKTVDATVAQMSNKGL